MLQEIAPILMHTQEVVEIQEEEISLEEEIPTENSLARRKINNEFCLNHLWTLSYIYCMNFTC